MSKISGDITIGRPVEVVFDYVADQTNEPHYNPAMVRSEKLTAGPVGIGTRFRAAVRSVGRTVEMLIEYTEYQRPRLLASRTSMHQADIEYTLTFEPVIGGTRMRWSGRLRPKGFSRLVGPLITRVGERQEQRNWEGLKRLLENASVGGPGASRGSTSSRPTDGQTVPGSA